jgi:hypothetical protein
LLLVSVVVGGLFTLIDPSKQELREAIAEADQLDPGWRWQELEARRKVIPDEENAALRVLAAHRLLPPGAWPPLPPEALRGGRGPFPNRVGEAISYLPPPVQLHEALALEIRSSLAAVEPALVEARKLRGLSEGRYPVAWGENVAGMKLDSDLLNHVEQLLIREAMTQAHAGQVGDGLATGRAVLVVGRSVGDQPGLDPLVTRLFCQRSAVLNIERTLAQGTPPPDELCATQELLADEAARPLLLNGLRGARADTGRAADAGYVPPSDPSQQGRLRGLVGRLGAARRGRSALAELLHKQTECVEIAKLPIEKQRLAFDRVKSAGPPSDSGFLGHNVWYITATYEDYCRLQALLRSAIAGLALERYRADKGRWPEQLDELFPAYLKAVPLDPFDAQPLRYTRIADGVVVSSRTADGEGKRLGRMSWSRGAGVRGVDLGFRLWDVDRRRQLQAEVLPMPNSSK